MTFIDSPKGVKFFFVVLSLLPYVSPRLAPQLSQGQLHHSEGCAVVGVIQRLSRSLAVKVFCSRWLGILNHPQAGF